MSSLELLLEEGEIGFPRGLVSKQQDWRFELEPGREQDDSGTRTAWSTSRRAQRT